MLYRAASTSSQMVFSNSASPPNSMPTARSLAVMGKSTFEPWSNALLAAGLISLPWKVQTTWDQQKVIAAIQTSQQQGLRLGRIWQDAPALTSGVRRYFGIGALGELRPHLLDRRQP